MRDLTADIGDPASYCVLSPHSDDAALSLAGTLRYLGLAGREISVITCFSRSAFALGETDLDADSVTKIRQSEDRAFTRQISVRCSPMWMNFLDAPLRGIPPESLFTAEKLSSKSQDLADELVDSIERLIQKTSAIFVPLGIGSHIDHLIVQAAGLRLLSRGCRNLVFYEDLPYAAQYPIVALDKIVARIARRLGISVRPYTISFPDLSAFKTLALRCYPSQIPPAWIHDVLLHAKKFLESGNAERVWKVTSRETQDVIRPAHQNEV